MVAWFHGYMVRWYHEVITYLGHEIYVFAVSTFLVESKGTKD